MQCGNGDRGEVLGLHVNEDNPKCGKENAAAHISYLNGSGLGRLYEKLSKVLNTPLPPNPPPPILTPTAGHMRAVLTLTSWLGS